MPLVGIKWEYFYCRWSFMTWTYYHLYDHTLITSLIITNHHSPQSSSYYYSYPSLDYSLLPPIAPWSSYSSFLFNTPYWPHPKHSWDSANSITLFYVWIKLFPVDGIWITFMRSFFISSGLIVDVIDAWFAICRVWGIIIRRECCFWICSKVRVVGLRSGGFIVWVSWFWTSFSCLFIVKTLFMTLVPLFMPIWLIIV